jgi:hypothetical protein
MKKIILLCIVCILSACSGVKYDKRSWDAICQAPTETEKQALLLLSKQAGVDMAKSHVTYGFFGATVHQEHRKSDCPKIKEKLNSVKSIQLGTNSNNNIDIDLNPLRNFTNLEHLTIRFNKFVGSLKSLEGLSNLKSLSLRGTVYLTTANHCDIDRENLKFILGLKKLESLEVSGCKMDSDTIGDLGQLPNLRELNISGNSNSDSLRVLSQLKKLKRLSLIGGKVRDISPLRGLSQLEVLFIGNNSIEDLSPLSALKKLRVVELGRNPYSSIEALKKLRNIEKLGMKDCNVTDFEFIKNWKKLKALDTKGCNLTTKQKQFVASLSLPEKSIQKSTGEEAQFLEPIYRRRHAWQSMGDAHHGFKGLFLDDYFFEIGAGFGGTRLEIPGESIIQLKYLHFDFSTRKTGWTLLPYVEYLLSDELDYYGAGVQYAYTANIGAIYRFYANARKIQQGELYTNDDKNPLTSDGFIQFKNQIVPHIGFEMQARQNRMSGGKTTSRFRPIISGFIGLSPGVKYLEYDSNKQNPVEKKTTLIDYGSFLGVMYLL